VDANAALSSNRPTIMLEHGLQVDGSLSGIG